MLKNGQENGDGRNMFPLSSQEDTEGHNYKHKEHIREKLGIAGISTIINKSEWHNPYHSTQFSYASKLNTKATLSEEECGSVVC
jgi:hypothetical protein